MLLQRPQHTRGRQRSKTCRQCKPQWPSDIFKRLYATPFLEGMGSWWGVCTGSTVRKTPSGMQLRTHSQPASQEQAAGSSRSAELSRPPRTELVGAQQGHRTCSQLPEVLLCEGDARLWGRAWTPSRADRHTERQLCLVRVKRYAALRTCSRAASQLHISSCATLVGVKWYPALQTCSRAGSQASAAPLGVPYCILCTAQRCANGHLSFGSSGPTTRAVPRPSSLVSWVTVPYWCLACLAPKLDLLEGLEVRFHKP